MLATQSARAQSTEATVGRLLAHESAGDVARMQNEEGWTALMLAASNAGTKSTDATVARLLEHESAHQDRKSVV